MKQERDRRRWWLGAFALFLGLLGIWILAVILLSPAGASSFSLNLGLGSRLHADYSADEVGRRVGVLRLSIVQDVLRDVGLTGEEAEAQQSEVEVAMSEAVPTATARNFGGEPPHTATPAPTATPVPASIATDTPEPTPTSTETARPTRRPTRTRMPTRTPTPTGSLNATATRTKTPTPTGATPTPTRCLANPVVEILSPTGNPTYGPGDSVPAQAFAYDPDNVGLGVCGQMGYYPGDDGVGINRVDFEIWQGATRVYSHSESSAPYCGFGGGNPCDTFPVSSSTWPGGPPVTSGGYTLRARSMDAGSNYSGWASVYFTLDISTPTATSAPTLTDTATATPPATPTPTDTPPATLTPTDTPTEMPTATGT